MSDRPLVVQTEELETRAAEWLGQRCDLVRCEPQKLATLNGELEHAAGLVVRTYTKVNREVLDHMPGLRVVGRAGVGLENIDVDACLERGVQVVHTPDANSSAVAELVMAMLLDAIRPRHYLKAAVSPQDWCGLRCGLRGRRQLCEMTVGILGMGKVGTRVARAVAGLGARVQYHDLIEIPPAQRQGATCVDQHTLLTTSDVVTVHVDARPSNDGLLGDDLLRKLKPDAILVNTSRGPVVVAAALARLLHERPGMTALLDVHDPEPIGPDYPLLACSNALLTPHIGAATELANQKMSWVVEDVWRVLSGQKPIYSATLRK
ncbi:MAG: (S)-sulfolactate dehydrogenase [Phycisphaerales bacterium]|nr:(S)-sulfolactate dehydrogenase [Phycisphaerales bacterium]